MRWWSRATQSDESKLAGCVDTGEGGGGASMCMLESSSLMLPDEVEDVWCHLPLDIVKFPPTRRLKCGWEGVLWFTQVLLRGTAETVKCEFRGWHFSTSCIVKAKYLF